MNFFTRLSKFLIGFLIGSLLVYFFLVRDHKRDLKGWLPQERIIQDIQKEELAISQHADCQLKCLGFLKEDLDTLIKEGKVKFAESHVRKEPCPVYFIESAYKENTASLEIEKCSDVITLMKIEMDGVSCNCY